MSHALASKRLRRRATLALWLLLVPLAGVPLADTRQGQRSDAVVLELPDLGGAVVTESVSQIPTADLKTLRIRIAKSLADRLPYGKIYTAINGEAANTVQRLGASSNGYVITIDLTSKPHIRLRPGKNAVELTGVDRDGAAVYTSFVLVTGQSGDPATGAAVEITETKSGTDREPPKIFLVEPNGPVSTSSPARLLVKGTVVDAASAVTSVTVNGQPATLGAAAADRGLELSPSASMAKAEAPSSTARSFTCEIARPPAGSAIVVVATDAAGNVARVQVPVVAAQAKPSTKFTGKKYAVVVGISKYRYHEGGLHDLRYCDADARAVRDFLMTPQGGSFAPGDVLYLENDRATLENVRSALENFLPRAHPEDLIFVYLAGHGSPDPFAPQNLYFLMNDTKAREMADTALPMKELHDMISFGIRAERLIIFVDTCHSSGLSGEQIVTTRGLENNLVNLYAEKLFQEKGAAILTSSDINETSQESPNWGGGHGIFTFALLEGLGGRADTNGDRLVTAGELFAFVRDRVRIETSFQQNPRALPGINGDIVLSFVAPGKRG